MASSSPRNERLRTAKDVMDRLIWDSSIENKDSIMIGYRDRDAQIGTMEVPLGSFQRVQDGGDIPEHRIVYIRNSRGTEEEKDQGVLWDREGRVDRVFGSTNTRISKKTALSVREAKANSKKLGDEAVETALLESLDRNAKANRSKLAAERLSALDENKSSPSMDISQNSKSNQSLVDSTKNVRQESGRKRQYTETSDPNLTSLGFPSDIRGFRLEAIFHPKFENESSDRQIRQQMLERITSAQGYLEASLKHSGSLLLWSGGQRYYSKNAADNQFSLVGEILLRQHFGRVGFQDKEKEDWYQTCSNYVEANRLTLSFEVVTSVLGDHGQRPKRDFLILTAVADKKSERFFSTPETIAFAQEHRLPSNDVWVYSTANSARELFRTYDELRETGLASTVISSLAKASDHHLVSMYPHTEFQGEIIEGIVLRYVPYRKNSRNGTLEHLEQLSLRSKEISQTLPPGLQDCFELLRNGSKQGSLLTTNLRLLAHQADKNDEKTPDKFKRNLQSVFETEPRKKLHRLPKSADVDIVGLARNLANAEDQETGRIAKLISKLSDLNIKSSYAVHHEKSSLGSRWLFIVHVYHDASFQKYHHHKESDDMNLFRGFSIELLVDDDDDDDHRNDTTLIQSFEDHLGFCDDNPEEFLMLKMKFLPYMIRTFACRNHLRTLRQGGIGAFVDQTTSLLTRWQVSQAARNTWQPFFLAWANYSKEWLTVRPSDGDPNLPLLSDSSRYLDHLELFTKLYDSGKVGTSQNNSPLRGLVVVLSPEIKAAEDLSSIISSELGGASRLSGLSEIKPSDMGDLCEPHKGVVCAATTRDGKRLQQLTKAFPDNVSIVFYKCDQRHLECLGKPDAELKQLGGQLNGFKKKIRCAYKVDLSPSNVSSGSRKEEPFRSVVQKLLSLNSADDVDTRPGMVVFFPGIPGCGKSSITSSSCVEAISSSAKALQLDTPRNIKLYVGDATKKKFWPMVKMDRFKDRSSIALIDKNVPAVSWDLVGDICAATKAIGVPVIPDASVLQTTEIHGIRRPDGSFNGNFKHCYPFSLSYYAICMHRVLARKPDTHNGGLDAGLPRCCMVVAKFMGFYRRLTADNFVETLQDSFASKEALIANEAIILPFANDGAPQLPTDLKSVLEESLQVQCGYDAARVTTSDKTVDAYLDDLELRLRGSLEVHSSLLREMAVPEAATKEALADQLLQQIKKLDLQRPDTATAAPVPFVKLVSVDINGDDLHACLRDAAKHNEPIQAFLGQRGSTTSDEKAAGTNEFVRNTHVTILHSKETTQLEIRSLFAALEGETVDLTIDGLLWSEDIAALAVSLPKTTTSGAQFPPTSNAFSHVTIWYKTGVQAFKSNELPILVSKGTAQRVGFAKPVHVSGKVSLWDNDKTSKA